MKKRLGEERAKKMILSIKEGKIQVDRRPNHGKDFYGAYEQLHKEIFHNYLGSCSRYLTNKYMEVQKYHG